MTAPFGRRIAAVAQRRAIGPYAVLEIEDWTVPEPGQFYMLAAVAEWGGGASERPFLPRALSALSGGDGCVGFLLEDVGPGTHRLCQLEPGEEVYLVGPLGCGFAPPREREAILVGGGVGIPPLALYQERYGGEALIGFRDRHHAQAASLFSRAIVATDDGSQGHHGLVTDLLLDRLTERDEVEILSCGPAAMLDAVGALARSRPIPAQLALEAPMACGFGACFGCVVETREGYRRVCVDGPVFEAAVLA
jgi:dihydroorotate dehydrogenase electron transfer subunit